MIVDGDRSDMDMAKIKEAKEKFKYSSLEYIEALDGYEILREDATALVLSGFNPEANCVEYHWAANDPQAVIGAIPLDERECLITFIPRAWVPAFEAHGFFVRSEWRDYWKASLDDVAESGRPEFLKCAEAEEASDVTRACRGQSRGFTGQTPGWIAGWMDGSAEDVAGSGVTDSAILIQRNEKLAIVGLVCTGIYGHASQRGAIAWIREIAVRPDSQQRGIARRLLGQALVYAKERGARRAFLAADECNTHAIHLYTSLGFEPEEGGGQIDMQRNRG